jgi:hypothetical protein
VQIVNDGIDGSVLQDRLLLTGDSPLAGNALGKLAARTLLDAWPGADPDERTGAGVAGTGTRPLTECGGRGTAQHSAPLGYDRVLVFATGTGLERGTQRVYWIEGDWFGDGSDTDLARYLHACPVNRHVLDSDAPFFWSKRQGVRGERYQVVKQPRGEGLHGLQVPVFGTTGLEGAISFAGQRSMHRPARDCSWKLLQLQHSVPRAGLPNACRAFRKRVEQPRTRGAALGRRRPPPGGDRGHAGASATHGGEPPAPRAPTAGCGDHRAGSARCQPSRRDRRLITARHFRRSGSRVTHAMRMCAIAESKDDAYETATGRDGCVDVGIASVVRQRTPRGRIPDRRPIACP